MCFLYLCQACADGRHEDCDGIKPPPFKNMFGGSKCSCGCEYSHKNKQRGNRMLEDQMPTHSEEPIESIPDTVDDSELKQKVNNFLFQELSGSATIDEVDEIAAAFVQAIMMNRSKHASKRNAK